MLNTAPKQLYLLSIALLQMNTMYLMLEKNYEWNMYYFI